MDIENFKTTARVDGNIVIISNERIQNNFKTEQEGEPVFEDVPFIRIITPSAKNQEAHRKMTADDKNKYKEIWESFQKKEAHKAAGTPLALWPEMEAGLIPVYEHNHVYTVEDLVGVSENNIGNLGMGALGLQKKAKLFLENKSANDVRLEQALDEIAELKELVDKLTGASNANLDVSDEETKEDEPIISMSGHA